ncbi:MAG: aspartyl protease family protein [Candidatus Bathyarchaeia archaeon]
MGHVTLRAVVELPRKGKPKEVEFLADTGASYMAVTKDLARDLGLGLEIVGEEEVTLADKCTVMAPIAPIRVRAKGREAIVFTVIADVPMPLFGAFTLEALGLAVDSSRGEVVVSRPTALML